MKVVFGLLALVWLRETPWAQVLIAGLILVGIAALGWMLVQNVLYTKPEPILRVEPRFEPSPRRDDPWPQQTRLLSRIEELETELRRTRSEVQTLKARNTELEHDLQSTRSAASRDQTNPLFRRVGLDQDAPEWVVVAVRRAYRKRLHPDAHPAGAKAEAERRFKQAEGVFDEIWRVKGFQS